MFITDDNHLAFSSQSGDVVLRAFVVLSWILIPKNVTLRHSRFSSFIRCHSNADQNRENVIESGSVVQ